MGSRRRRLVRIAIAVLPALALSGAPMSALAPPTCRVCPPTCPMHAHESPKPKLGCHRTTSSPSATQATTARPDRHCAPSVGLTRPGCPGGGHERALLAVAKAVLASGAWTPEPAPTSAHRTPAVDRVARGSDPPDSPPPISSV